MCDYRRVVCRWPDPPHIKQLKLQHEEAEDVCAPTTLCGPFMMLFLAQGTWEKKELSDSLKEAQRAWKYEGAVHEHHKSEVAPASVSRLQEVKADKSSHLGIWES